MPVADVGGIATDKMRAGGWALLDEFEVLGRGGAVTDDDAGSEGMATPEF